MDIIIKKEYKENFPISLERLIKRLLLKVPEKDLVGIGTIVLVDRVYTSSRDNKMNKVRGGIYIPKKGGGLAKIMIAVGDIYKGMPRLLFYLPFIPDILIAGVLYHEIGHHCQFSTHGIKRDYEEDFAEKYKEKLLKKAFLLWGILLIPFYPLVKLALYFYSRKDKQPIKT